MRKYPPVSHLKRRRISGRAVVLAGLVTGLAGCAGPLSALEPAGPAADAIATLWWIMFWGAVALFLLVGVLYFIVLYRPAVLARFTAMQWIVGGGLVMPTVVLVALVGAAFVLGERLIPRPLADAPPRVFVHAFQWDWQFSYEDSDGVTGQMHIPAGQPVDVVVTTADVIHGFWIPRLAGKIDAIPGHENVLRIQADRPGAYRGVCAEFCGNGHTDMRFEVIAHAPDDYEAALAAALDEAGR